MSERRLSIQPESEQILLKARTGFFVRVAKYTMVRILTLAVMLIIGMFVAVIVLNKGGFIDQIYHADIEEALGWYGYSLKDATPEEKQEAITKARYAMEEAAGLHTPFLQRCVRWTIDALTLHLGNTTSMTVRGRTISIVEMLVKERLPYTLLLFGVSNFLIFFISIFFALYLFRKYEGLLDRIVVFLSPLSSIPSWLHGVFLVIVFCAVLRVLPYPRSFTRGLEVYFKHDIWLVLKYMILPVTAIFLNLFFQSVYSWRTYFLLQSGEDYLELAKAKGLPDKLIERRYLLRPSLPYILTSLAMTMIGVWQMSLILEKFFFWPGLGSLFFDSLSYFPFTGSIIVLFAYLLAFTVLILDISYALVDPRVRIGSNESVGRVARKPRPLLRQWLKNRSPIFRPRVHLPEPVFKHHVSRQAAAGLDKSQPEPYPKPARAYKLMVTEIRRYPSAMLGVAIIGLLILVSICTVIAIPYKKAVTQWRGDGNIWVNNPKFAQPSWSNWFRKDKLPTTIILDNRKGTASKVVKVESVSMRSVTIDFSIDYPYGGYPQDLVLNIDVKNGQKRSLVNLLWVTPDGREVKLDNYSITSVNRYSFEYQWYNDKQNLLEVRAGPPPWEKLFVATGAKDGKILQGTYHLRLQGFVFDEAADLDAEMVLYGQVHGLAGTDDQRRDLVLAVLWGTPFSLLFGLLGALGTGLLAMIIAATGVWFGGWVDITVQRLTEVNMLLPAFPMAIMIYFLYTHNIWAILGVIILLSIFGNALKNFRAAFLQAKQAGYIEAAQVYSAGNWRIILHYMVPRIIPLLIPQLVALVPSYIFLEPTLAFVGIVDPYLPTWGKILMTGLFTTEKQDMIYYMNLLHNPYLALEPIGLMFLTGLAFSLLGMALDRIFNPRLRSL